MILELTALALFAQVPVPDASTSTLAGPQCQAAAARVLAQAEERPMRYRWKTIKRAFEEDPKLACGVPIAEYWKGNPELPSGCSWWKLDQCVMPGALFVDRKLVKDVDDGLYVRVQETVAALRKKGKLTSEHERLLMLALLSNAESQNPPREEDEDEDRGGR